MKKISEVSRLTDNPHLNLYHLKGTNRVGKPLNYYIASRVKNMERLKLKTKRNDPDGIIVYSLYGEKRDRVVLVRQYRYSIDDYIYEFPAGLVEEGEGYREAGIRELKEETGLSLELIDADPMFEKPGFMSVGMTDESCATIYGYASGTPSKKGQEDSEEIEIVLADREEVKRILKAEHVAIMCAYMLMHFLQDKEPFDFLNL